MRWLGLAQRQSKANKAALIVAQEPTQSLGLAGIEAKLQERVSGLDTQLAEYQKRHSELESSYSQLQERTLATQQAKPTPPPSLSDWGGLAAAAAIFAASASSRRPLVAGLTAGAAALEAQRANNQEGYAAALEGWYKNMNFALKQEELAGNAMKNILTASNTTTQQQIAALRALGTNENMQRRIATGDMRVIQQGVLQHEKLLEKFRKLGDTRLKEGSALIASRLAAGLINGEQAQEEFAALRNAVEGDTEVDPATKAFRDQLGALGGVKTPKPSPAAATTQAQNERAASANQFFNNPASKAGTAKWKDPVSGLEYSWREMRDVKDGIRGALTTKQEELSKVFTTKATPAAAAPAAPAAQQLPRAQAEGAPAGSIPIPEQYRERFQEGAEVSQNGRNYRVQGGMLIPAR